MIIVNIQGNESSTEMSGSGIEMQGMFKLCLIVTHFSDVAIYRDLLIVYIHAYNY